MGARARGHGEALRALEEDIEDAEERWRRAKRDEFIPEPADESEDEDAD
jgi:hypothetical protein